MMGTMSTRKGRDERREQILGCARRLFRTRPYAEVSNAEIAAAAGVSRGLLNHYFGTKRELYLAAVAELLATPMLPVPAYVAGAGVRDRVRESVERWLEMLERNQETWLGAVGTEAADPELARLVDEARDRAVDGIIEVTGIGPAAAAHPEVRGVLRGYSGMAEATSREWLKHGRLGRDQARLLLEESLMHLIERVVPALTGDAG